MKTDIRSFEEYVSRCVSPCHCVAESMRLLKEEGFEELPLSGGFTLRKGGKYSINCRNNMAVAFTVGEETEPGDAFRLAAAHVDWPCFYVKPAPEQTAGGCLKLSVEPYGGMIMNTWMDRPLSCAGTLLLKGTDSMHPVQKLIDFERPLCTIPNLAIHMNREVNKGVALNASKDLLPVCAAVAEGLETKGYFLNKLAEAAGVQPEEILAFDMVLYNAELPCALGFEEEFLSAPRLDNLTSAFACLAGVTGAKRERGVNLIALFDNEEIGSKSKSGADSATLGFLLEKIALALGYSRESYLNALLDSFLLSCDVAHAIHPNYADKADPKVHSEMNRGLSVKLNYEQRYSTQASGYGLIAGLCKENGIPYSLYMNRADLRGGSTLGAYSASGLSVETVDVGVPILAMHSARELMAVKDQEALQSLVTAYFGA